MTSFLGVRDSPMDMSRAAPASSLHEDPSRILGRTWMPLCAPGTPVRSGELVRRANDCSLHGPRVIAQRISVESHDCIFDSDVTR
jgi:hypothetical protein